MSLGSVRAQLAAAASSVEGVAVMPKPNLRIPGPGDGWVAVVSVVPATFRTVAATFQIIVCLGSNISKAEDLIETYGVPVLDAVTNAVPCGAVRLEPVSLATEQGGTLHGFTLTLTTEV